VMCVERERETLVEKINGPRFVPKNKERCWDQPIDLMVLGISLFSAHERANVGVGQRIDGLSWTKSKIIWRCEGWWGSLNFL
jgi:hypothetical protein